MERLRRNLKTHNERKRRVFYLIQDKNRERERERQCPNSRPTIFLVYLKSTIFLFRVPRTLTTNYLLLANLPPLLPCKRVRDELVNLRSESSSSAKVLAGKWKRRKMFDPSTSPSSARANINLSIREEEEDCVRIWLSWFQCRTLFLGTRVQHISLFREFQPLFTDIAKYFPPPMDLVSGSGVTRDARKRKVEVLLSGEEFEEADWLQSRKWISANRQFQFFFFTLDRSRRALSLEMIKS